MAHGAKGPAKAVRGGLSGECLCGVVRYTLADGFRLKPYACHCTDCQTRTGSAFSLHMLFRIDDLTIEGDLDIAEYHQPSGAEAKVFGCQKCKARIYAVNNVREGFGSLRCGTLYNSHEIVPAAHIWVRSKQPWIALPDDAKTMETNPETAEEWVNLVGIA
ncbi:GFA family protein [Erythrobacter ani]|uniref:GFA family protein n=1 Tax=Erythrobacter ani TaxID=2827235 RepID=A0ABS6SPA7_9SPHN|nr:GFA family protein [Erythrobacter ani]